MTPLDAPQFSFKVPVAASQRLLLKDIVPVFHSWIVEDTLPELLIDVADYAHVREGPGVLLIAHEAAYSIDETYGEQGLLYVRKRRDAPLSPEEAIRDTLRSTLLACRQLEEEPRLNAEFDLTRIQFRINNRKAAPNSKATFEAVAPILSEVLTPLLGAGSLDLVHREDPRELFLIHCNAPSPGTTAELLDQLPETAPSKAPGLLQITGA